MNKSRTRNSNIKLALAVVSMFTILATVFVAGAVPASAENPILPGTHPNANSIPPGVALYGAEAVKFFDATTYSGNIQPIFTVEFSPSPCDEGLVGGTIHSAANTGESSKIAIGHLNSDEIVINSHLNTAAFQGRINTRGTEACERLVTITSNLNCTFAVRPSDEFKSDGFSGVTPVASVTKASPAASTGTTSLRFSIFGQDVGELIGDLENARIDIDTNPYFRPSGSKPVFRSVRPIPSDSARLRVQRVNDAGQRIGDLPSIWDQINGAKGLQVRATDCDAPKTDAYRVSNAEPTGSINLATDLSTRSGCMAPNGTSLGAINVLAGNQATLQTLTLPSGCTYNQGISQGTGTVASLLKTGIKSRCDISGILYFLNGSTLGTAVLSATSAGVLNVVSNQVRLMSSTGITGTVPAGANLVQLTLFVNTNCPESGFAEVTYTVDESVGDTIASGTDVEVMVETAAGAPMECAASRSAANISGARVRITIDEGPPAIKAARRIPGTPDSATFTIIARTTAGEECSYKVTYPGVVGSLNLQTEQNGFPPPAPGVTRDPATAGPAEDGTFDGVIEVSGPNFLSTRVTAGYTLRPGAGGTPDAALYAADPVRFVDGTSHGGNIQPIFTVDFSSSPCDEALVGGTIHSPYTRGGASTIALGVLNSDVVVINSHFNEAADRGDTTVASASVCVRTITFTSNLNCAFDVRLSTMTGTFSTTPIASVAKDTAEVPANTRSASFSLHGVDEATLENALTEDGAFFIPNTTSRYLQAINPVPARDSNLDFGLQASALGPAGLRVGDPVAWGVNENDFNIRSIQVAATDCDAPRAGAYRVANAEPARSVSLTLSLTALSGCMPPEGTPLGLIDLAAGNQRTPRAFSLHPDCSYGQEIRQAPESAINPVTSGLKAECDVGGLIYFLTGANRDTLQVAFLSTGESTLQIIGNEVRFVPDAGVPLDGNVVQLTLFITANCPLFGVARVTYTVDDAVNSVVARTPITIRIEPTAGSPAGCAASPGVVTINGASAATQISEGPTAKSSTRITTSPSFASVNILTNTRAGLRCSYKFTYPRSTGALSIETEGNGFPPAVAGITRAAGVSGPAEDNTLDGVLEISSRILVRRSFRVTVGYNQRELPVRVLTSFDEDVLFKTDDLLSFVVSVVGDCARFSEVLARALGTTGLLREVQAYPGVTSILDESLAAIERPTSPEKGNLLTTLQPIIIHPETRAITACTLQVEELVPVSGCTVIGGPIKRVTFSTGLEAFEFTFDHSCPGLPKSASARGLTN